MAFFLGIDLGTSYFKAGVFDERGNLIGLGRSFVDIWSGDELIRELPLFVFWSTLHRCVSMAMTKAGINPKEISAVSYSSQANSFILLDRDDIPLTPLVLWTDARVGKMPKALKSLIGRNDFKEKTGLGILPGIHSMTAKIVWFQDKRSDIWGKVKSIMSISDYLTFSFTGKKVTDFSTSSMTGLFDMIEERWWGEALHTLNIDKNLLSLPMRTGSYVGGLTESGAKKSGLPVDIPFFLGGLDHHMVAVGAGLPHSNSISESTGTVLACVNYVKGYYPRNEINTAPGLDKEHYFQMVFNTNGASTLEWYQKIYAPDLSIMELLNLAENIEPGAEGLLAKACANNFEGLSGFSNVKKDFSHAHFVRAILESTRLSLRELVEKLEPSREEKTIIPSGGGARSSLWLQIKADILNRKFLLPESGELGCKGAALLCALGTSYYKDAGEAIRFQTNFKENILPNPLSVESYRDWYNKIVNKNNEQIDERNPAASKRIFKNRI